MRDSTSTLDVDMSSSLSSSSSSSSAVAGDETLEFSSSIIAPSTPLGVTSALRLQLEQLERDRELLQAGECKAYEDNEIYTFVIKSILIKIIPLSFLFIRNTRSLCRKMCFI